MQNRKRVAGQLFAKELVQKMGRKIAKVMLHGSVTKDTCKRESDIDLFVITLDDPSSIAKEAGNLWVKVFKETGQTVEPMFVSVWELEGIRGTFTSRVEDEGEIIYNMPDEELAAEEARGYLELAQQYLERAKRLYNEGDYRISADLAHNALELALRAAIRKTGKQPPRTHGGIIKLFGELYIVTEIFDRAIASLFTQCFATRNRARYEPRAYISEGDARTVIETAEKTIKWIKT